MAKALFHKSQRVFVKPVGTWAVIEHVVPHWVKDVDEPAARLLRLWSRPAVPCA